MSDAKGRKAVGIKLSDGQVLSIEEAITVTARSPIEGLFIGVDRHGKRYLRLRPDDVEADENQDSLSLI